MGRVIAAIESGPEVELPGYLQRQLDPWRGRVIGLPSRGDIPFEVDERAVIEFYAR
jgi:hypothetical protein